MVTAHGGGGAIELKKEKRPAAFSTPGESWFPGSLEATPLSQVADLQAFPDSDPQCLVTRKCCQMLLLA
jgi:hypothetical protein